MDTTNLRQIAGGTVIKQADRSSTMSFILQDAIGREVDLDGQTAQVALYTLKGKYWEITSRVQGSIVSFSLPGNLSEDDYILDISVAGYVFPSDRDFIIRVVKGFRDLPNTERAERAKQTFEEIRDGVEKESEKRLEGQLEKIDEKSESTIQAIEKDGQEHIKLIGTNKASAVAEIEAKKKEVLNIIEQKRQEFKGEKGDPGKDGVDGQDGKDGSNFNWNLLLNGDKKIENSNSYLVQSYKLAEPIKEGAEVTLVIKAKGSRPNSPYNWISAYNSFSGANSRIFEIYLNSNSDKEFKIYSETANWKISGTENDTLLIYFGYYNDKGYEPVSIEWVKLVYGHNTTKDYVPAKSEIYGKDGTVNIAEMTKSQLMDVKKQLDIPVADDFVVKEVGKGLSDNNFTNADKQKVNQLDDYFNSSMNKVRRLSDVYGRDTLPDTLETYHKLKPGYYFVSPNNLENQPTSYGFLRVLRFSTEFSLIWETQSQGFIYRKSGNASTMYDWKKIGGELK